MDKEATLLLHTAN